MATHNPPLVPLAAVRFTPDGRVWVNDVEVPNTGIKYRIEPNSIGILTVRVPVLDMSADDLNGSRVMFVATWQPDRTVEVIEASGETQAAAIRALADLVEKAVSRG